LSSRRILPVIIFICVSLLVNGCALDNSPGQSNQTIDGWTIEVVGPNVNAANGEINAVVDNRGKLHICFFDFGVGDGATSSLKYATDKEGAWEINTIDASTGKYVVGERNSIAVDGNGNAHISYSIFDNDASDENVETIAYATNSNGTWAKQEVFLPYNDRVRYGPSVIKVDNNGNVHIATLVDDLETSIKYANDVPGRWNIEAAAAKIPGFAYNAIDLELDGSGRPHIVYTANKDEDLYSADRTGGDRWSNSLLVKNLNRPEQRKAGIESLDFAIDNAGESSAILSEVNDDRVYLYENGRISLLASGTDSPRQAPRIVLDKDGKVYYLYFKSFSYGNFTPFCGTNRSGNYVYTQVSGFYAGEPNAALAVDTGGEVYIVYADKGKNELRVAHKIL